MNDNKENIIHDKDTDIVQYEDNTNNKLVFKFDLAIIELLGSQLYTTLPPILTEFISNAYDADATNVEIIIDERDEQTAKSFNIIIKDNGSGIANDTFNHIEQINNKFLKIGRRRRIEERSSTSKILKRKLQGKKGIGKLAGFGITDVIKITTTSNGITNSFILDYSKMKESSSSYQPEHIIINKNEGLENGTIIELFNIKRKTDISIKDLADNISKKLQIFQDDFNLTISHQINSLEIEKIDISNSQYLDCVKQKNNIQFQWEIPNDLHSLGLATEIIDFFISNKITGKISTTETPLKKSDQGIVLYANGKMCQDNYTFNDRGNDNFYSYLIGSINVDYIDENISIDNISTARDSLVWENEISQNLKTNVDIVIKKIQTEWREKRKTDKQEKINNNLDIQIDKWIEELTPFEQKTAKKLVDVVLKDDSLGIEKSTEFIGYIKDMYSFESFKNFASNLIEENETDTIKLLDFIKKWELIEAKEMAKIATGRIKTIEKFETMINNNESETKAIQPFLEEFPWIIDPKIINFRREVTFSTLLKENFPDDYLEEPNRRLDFLCHSAAGTIIIFELKRPNIKITTKYIEQVYHYDSFAKKIYPNATVKTYLISNNWSCDDHIESMIDSARQTHKFDIKSYSEMISEAKNYHNDFILKYEQLKKS